MKIISLQAENIKRLTAIEIKPDGNMVQITGKNGQGKTSVLDAIWWALAGTKHIQDRPIHGDETEARITLDLGDVTVKRTFKKREDETVTTAITVENADGSRFPSPQTMLDGLMGALTFDPLAFTRMPARDQYDTLKRFVPDVDFDEIEEAQKADYAARTELNRRAKEQRAAAEVIILPDAVMAERVNIQQITLAMQEATEANQARGDEERRRSGEKMRAGSLRASSNAAMQTANDLRAQADAEEKRARELDSEADGITSELEALPPLAEPIDISTFQQQITDAENANEQFRLYQQRRDHEEAADKAEADAKVLTDAMATRTKAVNMAIETADMPVDGLGIAEGQVTYNGLPFNQASDAEQLRVSCAIAMRDNHKLKVIRVRDGSLLDSDSLAILAEMADAADYQVWIERVDPSGAVGFVIEDGHLKDAASVASAAE